jgi:hypothetical protein
MQDMAGFMKRLRCLLGRHSPSRRSVRYDGHLKIGPCKYCGTALEKSAEGRWIVRRLVGSSGKGKVTAED